MIMTALDYSKIQHHMNKIDQLYEETHDVRFLMEEDSICHFFEGGKDNYETIAKFCEEQNIKRVIDIGSAYGFQSEIFLQSGIDYVGVNEHKLPFWNQTKYSYVVGRYPCSLPFLKEEDLGISVLCLTWNCYLYEGIKTLHEQCEAISRDFKHCLLYIQPSTLEIVSRYFKRVEKVEGKNLYYFSNK